MIVKKPFVTGTLFLGTGLLVLFSVSYIWVPLIQSSQLLIAIAEALGIVFCLIAMCFVVMYYTIKKSSEPAKKQDGIVSRMPKAVSKFAGKEADPRVISMPMTG